MYTRKFALSLAKQYRTCPPPRIRDDTSQQIEYERHIRRCPYCSSQEIKGGKAWAALSKDLERLFASKSKLPPEIQVAKGQLRSINERLSRWREGCFYTSPVVLVLEKTSVVSDDVLVCQTYHDISLASPGDLVLSGDKTPIGDLLIEPWNIYTMKESNLDSLLGEVASEIVDAVKSLEAAPGAYPDWAMVPRPFVEHDPRIYFRELEVEVGYTFSSRAVSELMDDLERSRLTLAYSSDQQLRTAIETVTPGSYWEKEPKSRDEILALVQLPSEKLPLAADDKTQEKLSANLVRLEEGRVKSIAPVPVEIHRKSGEITLSGRICELPESLINSHLICILDPEGMSPVSPVRHEWNEETGDFAVEFRLQKNVESHLRAAVLFEPIEE